MVGWCCSKLPRPIRHNRDRDSSRLGGVPPAAAVLAADPALLSPPGIKSSRFPAGAPEPRLPLVAVRIVEILTIDKKADRGRRSSTPTATWMSLDYPEIETRNQGAVNVDMNLGVASRPSAVAAIARPNSF